jgi:hypothetical protein
VCATPCFDPDDERQKEAALLDGPAAAGRPLPADDASRDLAKENA